MAASVVPTKKDEEKYDWIFKYAPHAGTITMGIILLYRKFGKRIQNADHFTPNMFEKRRWIKGKVTSVGDADGFRLFHTPPLWFRTVPTEAKDLKGQTIIIRIAGVDAPEGAHFGRPAQPFAAESHTWLKRRIQGKLVSCQVLHRDQYSRIVANVSIGRFFPKNLALEMLRAGCATTYEQASAVYGKEGKDAYLAVEKEARAKRRGMWKDGTNIETPAEYKRKYSQQTAKEESPRKAARPRPQKGAWFRWLRRILKK